MRIYPVVVQILRWVSVWNGLLDVRAFSKSGEAAHRIEDDANVWKSTLEQIALEYRQYQSQVSGAAAIFSSMERQDQLKAMEQVLHVMHAEDSSDMIKREALTQLARRYFYGTNDTMNDYNTSIGMHKINGTLAIQLYAQAALLGDPEAQFHVGIAYSYGYWGYPRDEAKALVNFYFAALGDNVGALMTLGHKYNYGIGVKKSCEAAARYYEKAANQAIDLRQKRDVTKPRVYDIRHRRIQQLAGSTHKRNTPSDDAVADYYHFSAEKGDADATLNVAYLYYYGIRGVEQDVVRAAKYFHQAHELGAESAAFHLGHIYANGIGVTKDAEKAIEFLEIAAKNDHSGAKNELSAILMEGTLVEKDHKRALKYLKSAAKRGSVESFYNLGVLQLQGQKLTPNEKGQSDSTQDISYDLAYGYFQIAALQGHTFATHKIGLMHLYGIGVKRSCQAAVDSFKYVAERGDWDRIMWQGYSDFKKQNYEASFLKYAVMAMQGLEVAQHNAAYMLDRGYLSKSSFASLFMSQNESGYGSHPKGSSDANVALRLYQFAALQKNVDAHLSIGDYYFYGKGGFEADYDQAILYYRAASRSGSAQAAFNLGYMREHGIGFDKDLGLALRHYQRASKLHKDARVPVQLAIFRVQVRQYIQNLPQMWRNWSNDAEQSREKESATVDVKETSETSSTNQKKLQQTPTHSTLEIFLTVILATVLALTIYFRSIRMRREQN